MPRQSSSVTNHPQLQDIEAALVSGESIRSVAARFGLSAAAINRHKRKEHYAQLRKNTGEVTRIDREIQKLIRAQNSAKKKRNTAEVLAIARELRNWYGLRSKAELMASAVIETQAASTVTRSEALEVARTLIETEVAQGTKEILEWLRALAERAGLSDGQAARCSDVSVEEDGV